MSAPADPEHRNMLSRERERCAHDRCTATKLIDIADEIRTTKLYGDAASALIDDLPQDQTGPLQALLNLIGERLTTIATTLDQEAHSDAA